MIRNENLNKTHIQKLTINKPRKILSMFIPLGENSIISLVDLYRSRSDIEIIDTDLYYTLKIHYSDFIISFFSRGLVTFEKYSNVES